jgi:NhaP-type Na+/H+ or K+/H+ antiporter
MPSCRRTTPGRGGVAVPDLTTALGLLAVVLLVSALASGVVERAPLSFPMLFLGLGVLLGARGLGVIAVAPRDPTLHAVAVVSLALVLFIDAVTLEPDELRRDWIVPVLTTGPGTLLTIGLVALAALLVLHEPPVQALLLGAALSSLDPVVLRDVVREGRIPRSIRRTLRLEAGTNDVVVLPAILILVAVAGSGHDPGGWLRFLGELFLLGPLAGAVVGAVGSWAVGRVDRRTPIRREYQALYGVGLVFAAFVAGDAVGGSGFLAAFVAGLAVVLLNQELCACFVEYGEVTAEMAMLLAFVLFGAALSTAVDLVALGPTLLFTALVIGVARPLAVWLVLHRTAVSGSALAFIGWFGPRGLNSLLLALLVLHHDVPGGERLLAVTGVVVVVSVVVHGVTATPLSGWYARTVAARSLAEERESTAGGLVRRGPAGGDVPRLTPAELAARLAGPDPPLVLDVRTRSHAAADGVRIPGSVRVLPDRVAEWAATAPPGRAVVTYCT